MSLPKKVVVLFGGRSGEHEVSLQSAVSVIDELNKNKYEVIPVGITKKGSWVAGITPEKVLKHGFPKNLPSITLPPDPEKQKLINPAEGTVYVSHIDVVMPLLHGTYGEDGTVQGLLELADLPYTGSGVAASSLAMDKVLCKALLAKHGFPQARYLYFLRKEWEQNKEHIFRKIENEIGYPCFVKPANLGSSLGISKVHNRQDLSPAINEAAKYDRKIIVEENIDGREIEVAVLGNDDPRASIPGEIVPCNEFYDYRAKYLDGNSQLLIPAKLPADTVNAVKHMAESAFKVVDCAGFARIDFFLENNSNRILINEINTIPGFTKVSMFPKLWEASGIPYAKLLDLIIEYALERHEDKNRSLTTYE